MVDNDLLKHAGEFRGYIENHKYEVGPSGVLFPKASALIDGVYTISSPGYEDSEEHNLLPIEGINYILANGLGAALYLAIYGSNYTPTSSLTAATFAATAGEFVSGTEGYTQVTRPLWEKGAAAVGARDNNDTKALFTIATATSLTVRGVALLSDQVKGAGSGVIVSADKFVQDRIQYATDPFRVGYRVRIQST